MQDVYDAYAALFSDRFLHGTMIRLSRMDVADLPSLSGILEKNMDQIKD